MPPLRPLRPLRPYNPRWSLPQVRWVSNGPRDQPKPQRDDPAQASDGAKQPPSRGLDRKYAKPAPQGRWYASTVNGASGAFRRQHPPPPMPSGNPQSIPPPSPEATQTSEKQDEHQAAQKDTDASDATPEPVEARTAAHLRSTPTQSPVATEPAEKQTEIQTVDPSSEPLVAEHGTKEPHTKKLAQRTGLPVAHGAPEKQAKARVSRTQPDASHAKLQVEGRTAAKRSPVAKHPPVVEHPSSTAKHTPTAASCPVCKETFPSIKALKKHTLWSDRCGIQESPYRYRHTCLRCSLIFDEIEDARRHFTIDPGCLRHMQRIKVGAWEKLPHISPRERYVTLVRAARKRSNILKLVLSQAAWELSTISRLRVSSDSDKDSVGVISPTRAPQPSGDSASVAPASNGEAAVTAQVQQLSEQVKMLTQALLASQNSNASTNPELARLKQALNAAQNSTDSHPSPQSGDRPYLQFPPAVSEAPSNPPQAPTRDDSTQRVPLEPATFSANPSGGERLTREIRTSTGPTKSSNRPTASGKTSHPKNAPTQDPTLTPPHDSVPVDSSSERSSEQSLLEELFPEASSYVQPHYTRRNPYPKLELPSSTPLVRRVGLDPPVSVRDALATGLQKRMESISVLQLLHCSTELTEADFRRIIPKGKHIQGWANDGEFTKVIPGRDPVSLERLPFYYLLFKTPGAALAYQKNAGRLHHLSQLHQPSGIGSAIPPPPGFVEDEEDIHALTTSFVLKPTGVPLSLNMLMQPYSSALRELFERGGYKPIVPSTSAQRKRLYKVLMRIEGYELAHGDLSHILLQDGVERGIRWQFHNGLEGVRRLRDVMDIRGKMQTVSASRPRAAHERRRSTEDDTTLSYLSLSEDEGEKAQQLSQIAMNRVYNRWVVEFEEEEAAQRFARIWNRKVVPINKNPNRVTWRDTEERRMCNAEFLW